MNGKGAEKGISESSQTRILDHVKKISYMPNFSAQGLRTGKTKTICMMVEDIADPFFSSIARAMEEIAYMKGYKILYSSTENNTQKAKDLIQFYRRRQVDGYILAPPPGIEEDINELIDDNLAVVLFDRTLIGIEADNVLVDNFDISYKAVKHLIENGYRNIAMITLYSEQIQMTERERGYKEAVDEIKNTYFIKNIGFYDHPASNVQEIQRFIDLNNNIDAVFFTTNYLAEMGLEAIRNLKLRIPEDLGIVVFDDDKLFRLFSPTITAIAQPIGEISEHVIKLMLMLLSGKGVKKAKKSIVLPAILQIRESSRPKSD
ncbi:LacI family DNA-binding transcriptional regulator [Mucilaginibacter dorajii]|uniref:LacI family DNA-binding transcriptional regulator n=1 Tax=Mucilaginibacter dorajii TaxID=692994 RepID=A0ABP7QYZ1_9SPHI